MPDPADLLSAARLLCNASPIPSEAQLRRAVSTAYYAVFHKVLRTAAARFMGVHQENTAGYRVFYRGFEHIRLLKVCEELDKPYLNNEYKNALQRSTVSHNMRDFARAFAILQAQRHLADYDPGYKLAESDASDIITVADFAIASFDRTSPAEQADVLAFMMIKTRA